MLYTLVLYMILQLGPNAAIMTTAYVPDIPSEEYCEYLGTLFESEHRCIPSKSLNLNNI
jgi:hypothetical protein